MNILGIILFAMSILGTLLWIIFYGIGYKKYQDDLAGVDGKDFLLWEIFYAGFGFMDLVRFVPRKKRDLAKIREISEVYGEKRGAFYYIILRSGEASYVLTFVPVGLLLAILSGNYRAAFLGPLIAAAFIVILERDFSKKITDRRDEILMELPAVLSKMILLINSGMVLREAWKETAMSGEGSLYVEMKKTVNELNNGTFEGEAYKHFADRCNVKEVRKFSSTVVQNLKKGSGELVPYLNDLSKEVWNAKVYAVQKKADAAVSKLIIPSVMVFVGILIMVIVPMLESMSF